MLFPGWTVRCLLIALTISLMPSRSMSDDLVIKPGGAAWQIFVPKGSADSVMTGAKDLQSYVNAVAGVEMPIVSKIEPDQKWVIYLGGTPLAREKGIDTSKLPPDGFRILTGPDWIIIAGRDYAGPPMFGTENPYQLNETYNPNLKISAFGDAGTQQGIYQFLRQFCGVRWYMPGPLGEVVPKLDQIVIPPTDLEKFPAFEYRYPYYCFLSSSDDNALWYRRAGFGGPFPVALNHTFQLFLKYKDTNPEYFALIDGQRDFTTLSSLMGPGNLNLANPGLIQRAIDDINEFFDKNPNERMFALVPPDGMLRISEDPESQAQIDETRGQAGRFSNYVWGFINKVAKGVYEKHPDKFIGGLAYEKYNLPPTNIDKMAPNVVVMICKSVRRSMPDEAAEAHIKKTIEGWRTKVDNIYCWEYYCDILFNSGWRGYPAHYPPKNIQKDLQFLKGKVRGEMIEAETFTTDQYVSPKDIVLNDAGLQHLRLYITSELLWNPDIDLNQTLSEYYRLFYGPAEKDMREFWEIAENAWENKAGFDPAAVYSRETLQKMLACLTRAEEHTESGSIYRARIDLIKKEFTPATAKADRLESLQKREALVSLVTTDSKPGTGLLSNSFWKGIPPISLIDSSYNAAKPPTHLRLAWTENALKVAITCFEPKMSDLKALVTKDNIKRESPIWEDDAVEVFFQPKGSEKTYQFIINSNAALFDAMKEKSDVLNAGMSWESGAEVAVKRDKSSWIVEMSIPWKSLGIQRPEQGLEIFANIYRSRYAGGKLEVYSWAPIISGHFYAPEEFGILKLSAQPSE